MSVCLCVYVYVYVCVCGSDGEPRGTALVSRRLETAMCYLGLGLGDVY